ncbi:homocysteine S-methyltransferase family protein [Microvirga rosea]|uniref:homocysteine S-methyltransferase family protein n=1 Tax=Microvirga rosea TaxID=2715425 RepID=UPI001D0B375E|nr:homocysteine S-methyltransferase family protein [Microvirga rosea]MCB8822139.1 homocysteine S-methyltransferase family protein [Microvirga rosea]
MTAAFEQAFQSGVVFLTDGGIETRLIYEFSLGLRDFASFPELFDSRGRAALRKVYTSYLDVAAQSGRPMLIGSPTWRAHPDGLRHAGFGEPDDLTRVNTEAVSFLRELRREMKLEKQVYIAGVIGPRGDGYRAEGAPQTEEAQHYHHAQARALADAGVDFLYAPTFASRTELIGVALAMAGTGCTYALAPVINGHGDLPDGSSLSEVISFIDATVQPRPLYYLTGCVHASTFSDAVADDDRLQPLMPKRLVGMKANASALPPEKLNDLDHVEGDEPAAFARGILNLHNKYSLRILGGCCGTDAGHIRALAEGLAEFEAKSTKNRPATVT